MTLPNTPEQLAGAIESMVASYIDEVRRAAQQAVERSLSRTTLASRASKGKAIRPAGQEPSARRRTAGELEELGERLYALVCTRPGESMVALSDELGVPGRTLQRPMAKLKTDGRVRSIGQRSMMRYFPAVLRAATSVD